MNAASAEPPFRCCLSLLPISSRPNMPASAQGYAPAKRRDRLAVMGEEKRHPLTTWVAVCGVLERWPGVEQDPPGGREVART